MTRDNAAWLHSRLEELFPSDSADAVAVDILYILKEFARREAAGANDPEGES